MANLIIERGDSTPFVKFLENGKLLLEGRSLSEDPLAFFKPLIDWVRKLNLKKVELCLKMEYLNTASTKTLMKLLKEVEDNINIESINIEWHYEMDDPDMIELGELFEEELERVNFNYFETVEFE